MESVTKLCADGQVWSEDLMYALSERLADEARVLISIKRMGIISDLGYNAKERVYSAIYTYEDGGYVSLHFNIDFGGGAPFPYDIEQYTIHVPNGGYIGGFDEHENFAFCD